MAEREALTADYVRSILHYDPETGIFTWRERPREHFTRANSFNSWKKRFVGKPAGNKSAHGYIRINICGVLYFAHRLAWLYMTGEWPEDQIDHANLEKADNRFSNLRSASRSQNTANRPTQPNNTSGYKGVVWDGRRNKWFVKIKINGRQKIIGYFSRDRIHDAAVAYERAARECFGEFARIDG
jgi:hypothetical protein